MTRRRGPHAHAARLWGLVLAVAALSLGHRPASGQDGCNAIPPGNDLVRSLTIGGIRTTYITNPHFLCQGGVEIFADSAEAFPDRGMSLLLGNVRYLEASRELRASQARYFSNEGRLQASGNLRVTDAAQGSSIVNGDLVYLLQTAFREVPELTVTTGADGLRPIAVLRPPPASDSAAGGGPAGESATDPGVPSDSLDVAAVADSTSVADVPDSTAVADPPPAPVTEPAAADTASEEAIPYTVVGDRIFLFGDRYFTASGTVEIQQDSLRAFADSAEYDSEGAGLVLVGDARVLSAGYDLVGRSITMSRPGRPDSRVHAMRAARLEGDDLLLTSAQIFLFLQEGALDRLVATPIAPPRAINADSIDLERPRAVVQDFILTSDSLEVRAPGQQIERVFAAGTARSESMAGDSLNVELLPEIARSDWLEGDTVIVHFAPVAQTATLDDPAPPTRLEVDEIIAQGSARTLYRLPPNDSTARPGVDPPAVHYVVGREIRITMEGQEVQGMQVRGQTRGVHLEPLQRRPPPDSAAADSTAVPGDTLAVIDTTGVAARLPVSFERSGEPAGTGRVRQGPSDERPWRPSRSVRNGPPGNEPWNRPWMN